MKIVLFLLTLLMSRWANGQLTMASEGTTPPLLYQNFGSVPFGSWPQTPKGKSFQLHVRNIWSTSNINVLHLDYQQTSARWSQQLQLSGFFHPGCKDYQFRWQASTKVGSFSSLGMQIGIGHTSWITPVQFWRPLLQLHYSMAKRNFYFACETDLGTSFLSQPLVHISPVWRSLLSVTISQEIQLQPSCTFTDFGLAKAEMQMLWKCNKHWLFAAGAQYPSWGWTTSMVWILPHRQQGWGYSQSAWVRPSLDYWIRFSAQ